MMLYEKERKRVGGVVYGGRRKTDEDRIEVGRKRSVDEASDHEMTDENESKKVKRGNFSPAMHLVVSGYEKWVGHAKIEDNDKVSIVEWLKTWILMFLETTSKPRDYMHHGSQQGNSSCCPAYCPDDEVRDSAGIRSDRDLD